MSTSSGRNLLRAQVGTPVLYRIFNIAYGLLFTGIILIMVINTQYSVIQFKWNWLLVLALAGTCFFFLLYKLVSLLPDIELPVEAAIVSILFVLFIALQFFAGWSLRVYPSNTWDFGVVFTSAQEYVLNGTRPGEYFLYFSNNSALYVFWVGFMSVLKYMGLRDFTVAAMVLNILLIDLSIYLLYRSARLLFGIRRAFLVLVAAFLTLPFILYVPIYYTDTLSMAFPIGAVYLWLRARSEWRGGAFGKAIGRFCIASALLGLGALLKISVLIVWIAMALDLLLYLSGKGRLRMLLAGLGAAAAVFVGGTFLIRLSSALPNYDYGMGIPFTHWVMMGLRSPGGYNDVDYQWTLAAAADKAGRFTATTQEIGARVNDMGVGGFFAHLANKLAFTFGDGTYTAISKLDRSVVAPGFLHEFAVPTGRFVGFTAYASFAVEAAMLVGMVLAAVKAVLRKNDCLTFARIAVFGLVLFLLCWETRARYLLNFLPVMMLCAVEAFPMERQARQPQEESLRKVPRRETRNHKKDKKNEEEEADVIPAAAVEAAETEEDPFDLFSPEMDGLVAHLADTKKLEHLSGSQPENLFDDIPPQGDPFFELAKTMQLDLQGGEAEGE